MISKIIKLIQFNIERIILTDKKEYNIELFNHKASLFYIKTIEDFLSINLEKAGTHPSHIYYKGLPSNKNARIDAMEGCTRALPLYATYVTQVKPDKTYIQHMRSAILQGVNPSSYWYWGDIQNFDQRLCEMHDVALCLWISKKYVFDEMNSDEKLLIKNWLKQSFGSKVKANNWILFKVLISLVYDDLYDADTFDQSLLYEFLAFEKSNGLFTDGCGGDIDHYNSWGMHYTLYFIYKMIRYAPIKKNLVAGGGFYFSLLNGSNTPLYGRSFSYRYALPCSLIVAAILTGDKKEETLKITKDIWLKYAKNDTFSYGVPSQHASLNSRYEIEPYIGPASSLWSFRSLILALILLNKESDKRIELIKRTDRLIIEGKLVYENGKLIFFGSKNGSIQEKNCKLKFYNRLSEVIFSRNRLKAKYSLGKTRQIFKVNNV